MTTVSIAIKITDFDISLDEIGTRLNLVATDSFLKGDKYVLLTPSGKKEKERPNNFWEYRLVFRIEDWPQKIIDKFIEEIISTRVQSLIGLAQIAKLEFFIGIAFQNEPNPSFHFTNEKIEILSSIGFDMDIDMYMQNGK